MVRISEWLRRRRCPYRRTTIVVCCLNLVAAVYVLRSLYTSYFIFTSSSIAAADPAPKISDKQLMMMEESIRIRRSFEPVELVNLLKGLKKDLSVEDKRLKLQRPTKRKLVGEVLQRLRELGADANTTQLIHVLENWRRVKLEEIRRLKFENVVLNSTTTSSEAKILKKVLKSDLHVLLEDFGLYIPRENTNKMDGDMGEDFEQGEEEIIAGPPIPAECHAEAHTDYAGAAVRWGLSHHKDSAAECCQACLDQAKRAKPGEMKCNIWVYCPSEGGCFSPDKYEHMHHECWLKQDVNPKLNFKDKYSESYRSWHPNAPILVPWMSGVIGS